MARKYRYPSVLEVAGLLVPAPYNRPWFYEAPVRHAIRVLLIMQGMSWARADFVGHSLVGRARIQNGTRQPAGWDTDNDLAQWLPDTECPICDRPFKRRWLEQAWCSTACSRRAAEIRWWCEQRVGVVEAPRCRFCNSFMETDLPQQKFCNRSCADKATKLDQNERADLELGKSIANARRNARWTQAQLAARAGINERYMGSIEEGKAVMSADLRDRILGLLREHDAPGRHCRWCEAPIPPERDPRAIFCCRQHAFDWHNDQKAKQKFKKAKFPNGHANGTDRPAADDRPGIAGMAAGARPDSDRADVGADRIS